jgi:hypothetical protein
MKTILISIGLHFFAIQLFCQAINWTQSKNWKLYSVFDRIALNYSLDSIDHIRNIPLNNDTIQMFLSNSQAWPKDKSSMWMSAYLCTYELDGNIRKIAISSYGGFFYDYATKQYYQINVESRDDWLTYLLKKSITLMTPKD